MKERLISGLVIVVIVGVMLYLGGIVFDIGVGLLAIGAFYELMSAKKDINIPNIMKIISLACMLMLMYLSSAGHSLVFGLDLETLSLVFLLILMPTVFFKKGLYRVNDAFYLAAITIFLGTVFNLFLVVYDESPLLFILVIVIAFTTDTFAYGGGKLIGKHKFTSISPNKTIEGCITGSIIGTIISTTFYSTLIVNNSSNILFIAVAIFLLTVVGQVGDLFFSLIKRENGIKDYSNLIPGHGGILDRIDSIIFILIALVFMIKFI